MTNKFLFLGGPLHRKKLVMDYRPMHSIFVPKVEKCVIPSKREDIFDIHHTHYTAREYQYVLTNIVDGMTNEHIVVYKWIKNTNEKCVNQYKKYMSRRKSRITYVKLFDELIETDFIRNEKFENWLKDH